MSISGWELCVRCHGREVELVADDEPLCEVCAVGGEAGGASTVQRPLG